MKQKQVCITDMKTFPGVLKNSPKHIKDELYTPTTGSVKLKENLT